MNTASKLFSVALLSFSAVAIAACSASTDESTGDTGNTADEELKGVICGGPSALHCPAGYYCTLSSKKAQATGTCNKAKYDGKFCGGFAGIACPKGYSCNLDSNNPDSGGECSKNPTCIDNVLCTKTSHWDSQLCACEPNQGQCVAKAACIKTSHWDSEACQCIPNSACIQTQACTFGSSWDSTTCKCQPDPDPKPTCLTLTCSKGFHCENNSKNGATCLPN